jgi:hypothetical protein
MARELRTWIAAALLGCLILGFVYLPPKADPLFGRRYREPLPPTPYHRRVQVLADEWQRTSIELRLLEDRARLQPELARRRAMDLPGPAVLIDSDLVSDSVRRLLGSEIDTAWSQLGLGVSKVSVGIVLEIDLGYPRAAGGEPAQRFLEPAYLLPDSSDRSTCVARIPIGLGRLFDLLRRPRLGSGRPLESLLRSNVGPCAFYAAFGSPGREIHHWLGGRRFDLAARPEWQRDGRAEPDRDGQRMFDASQPWFLGQVYRFPPVAVACMAGRAAGCTAAVLQTDDAGDSTPRVLTREPWWRHLGLPFGDQYLADVVREIGPDRFQRFWSSEQQVDTALATALHMPVGEWTQRWQANLVPLFRLGPSVSPASVLLSLLLAAIALAFVLRTAARRQVR